MESSSKQIWEVAVGGGLAVLGVYTLIAASRWEVIGINGPGPAFLPLIYGAVMLVAALVLAVSALRARPVPQAIEVPPDALPDSPSDSPPYLPADSPPDSPTGAPAARGGSVAALLTLIALGASLPLMSWLGFVVGFGLVMFFIIAVIFRRSPLTALITAAAISVGLRLAFVELLQAQMPASRWWGF